MTTVGDVIILVLVIAAIVACIGGVVSHFFFRGSFLKGFSTTLAGMAVFTVAAGAAYCVICLIVSLLIAVWTIPL